MRRNTEAAQRAQDRRQHEDSATRLHAEIPRLATLKLDITDGGAVTFGGLVHVRHVVVNTAPALFEIVCGDRNCKDGGHDLTWEIMRALRASEPRFEGSHECSGSLGSLGSGHCNRVLKYVATATYSA